MGDYKDYQKGMDLIFQEIEDKGRLIDQARYKNRLAYATKYARRVVKPYLKILGGVSDDLRQKALDVVVQQIINAADREFDRDEKSK